MKKVIVSFTLFIALCCMTNTASAKGVIIYSNGEKIETVKKLPDNALINDEHVNLGVMYEQFAIFWVPMWNYGETKYVLINDKKDTYYDLDEEDIDILKDEFSVNIPDKPAIGFWNKIGGKIIWGIVIFASVYGFWIGRNDDEEEETPTQEE